MAYTTVPKSTAYFNTKLYTGNYSTNAITGVGFQPDLAWIKSRGTAGENHYLFDALRGVTKYIHSDTTAAQSTNSSTLTAFGSDGFTVGANNSVNKSSDPLVSWNWKANGLGSSNTDGSINTIKTSANTTSGFSVGTWTGNGSASTIGHGLGVAPSVVIVKNTSGTYGWQVYHQALGATKYIAFDADTEQTSSQSWNNTAPTSTVFTVGASNSNNGNGNVIVFYAFAEKQGYSKFGSYIGNGNNDGVFLYTGFKPAFFLYKVSSATGSWNILDTKRDIDNPANLHLQPNSSNAEAVDFNIDLLSNGIKIRGSGGNINSSGVSYIYMAFAEEPLVSTNGVPATAR